ncbi:MAG: S8 family serine peptidase [Acutalibacteraceae bacterium]|nr:S8 family serine peptidase [Acutalibacteraceae bacterium]
MNLQKKLIATALSVAMLFSVTVPASVSATGEVVVKNNKPVASEKSEATLTVNESAVSRIEKSAAQPSKAGTLINNIKDTATYEEALRTVLDDYYTNGNSEKAEQLDSVVDSRGDKIFENYTNANEERKTEPKELGFIPGEVLAVTKAGISDEEIPDIINDERIRVTSVLPYTEDRKLIKIEISLEDTVENAIAKLESNENIEFIEKDLVYTNDYVIGDYIDDAKNEELYHLNLVKSVEAWQLLAKNDHEKIKVAVIDTGTDINHEDLKNVINKDLSVRITADGIICPLKSDNGIHGTHVSGIIAAEANNEVGVSGVGSALDNSVVDLIGIGCDMGDGGSFSTLSVYRAIKYAVENGARVINMSLGGQGDPNNIYQNAVTLAVNSGCVVVCAAGNDDSNDYYYPSDCTEAISVIALDETGENRAYFSNYGATKNKISAPGMSIYNTIPDNQYQYLAGTSMASPIVASIAAMVISVNPKLTASEVKDIIYASADDINGGGYDDELGYGRINAYKAVKNALEYKSNKYPTSLKLSNSNLELAKGATAKLSSKVSPENAIQIVSYHSKDDGIATVSSNGIVTAKSSGTTEIIACTANNIISKCTVTVKDAGKSKLTAPTAESIQTGTSTGATITWDSVENAEYYQIYACNTENGKYSYIGSTYHTIYSIDTFSIYAKPANTVYFLKVKAITNNKNISDSELSETISYVYIGQEPYLTTELISEEGYGNGIFLHWGAIVSSELYRTCVDDNKTVLLKTFYEGVDDNWYYDNKGDLEAGKTYTYTLKLFNTYKGTKYYGVESKETFVYQTDDPVVENCDKPDINSIGYHNNQIHISYLINNDYPIGRVYASSDNGESWFTVENYLSGMYTQYTDSIIDVLELKPATKYMFRYKYYNTGLLFGLYRDCSEYSNIVSVTTPEKLETPKLNITTENNGFPVLYWSGEELQDGYYTVYRRTDGNANWDVLADNIRAFEYTDITAEKNNIYYYQLTYTDPTPDVKFEADDHVSTSASNQTSDYSNIVSHRTLKEVKDICSADFSQIADVEYNGSIDIPSFTVTYRGTKLKRNVDYVAYSSNNHKVGRASITVTGIGQYSGEKVLFYNIVEPENEKPITYTVEYVDYNGTVLSTQEVQVNSYATAPSAPKRTGYIFMGWNHNGANITADTTITAQYKKSESKIYTVTFVDKENNVISSQKVAFGETAQAPQPPVFDGYEFVEWKGDFKNISNNTLIKSEYKATKFESGTGTESDPYIISTPEQLDYFSYVINHENAKYGTACYKLANNIYYNDITYYANWGQSDITGDMYCPENIWEPAGIKTENNTKENYFMGTFDGNGCSIFGLFVSETTRDYVGFIGYANNAVIRNLGIENSYFETRGNYAGAVVGMFSSLANDRAEIYWCFARDNYISANKFVGGFAGEIITINSSAKLHITNCYTSNSYIESFLGQYVGGFSGLIQGAGAYTFMRNCYANNLIYIYSDNPISAVFSGDIIQVNSSRISIYECYCYCENMWAAFTYYSEDPDIATPIEGVTIRKVIDNNFTNKNSFPSLTEYIDDKTATSNPDAVWVFNEGDFPRLYTENGRYTAEFYLQDELFYFVALREGEKLNVPYPNPDYGYYVAGWSGEIPETMPANNLTFFNMIKTNTYSVDFYVDGVFLGTQTYNENDVITPPTPPTGGKDIYWKDLPPVMPNQNIEVQGYTKQLGDVNGDSEINVIDVILVMRYIVNPDTLTLEQALCADVNSNKTVDIIDVISIQKYILGTITSF